MNNINGLKYAFAVVALVSFLLGGYAHYWWGKPRVDVVTNTKTNTQVVTVDKPVLVERDVVKFALDKKTMQSVLAEQAAFANRIQVLSDKIAALESSGLGKIVYVDKLIPGTTQTVREAAFKDWRLTFNAVGEDATYTLSQKFEAIATAGRDPEGQPTADVALFEIGPGDTRTKLTTVENRVIRGNLGKPRWWFSPTVQAGGGLVWTSPTTRFPSVVVGLQWLKRGSTKAAEDSLWSVATPVLLLSENNREPGLLPVSINLGRVKYQPFKDLWLSPVIGYNFTSGKIGQTGFAFTASF